MDHANASSEHEYFPPCESPFILRGHKVLCAKHELADCEPCLAIERVHAAARQAHTQRRECREKVENWGRIVCSGDEGRGTQSDLGGLPSLDFARYKNRDWLARTEPQVVNAFRTWDLRSPLSVFAPTRSGKTSGIVAKVEATYRELLRNAESGAVRLPPFLHYAAGYEIGEATKRRRLGERPHELIAIAMRAPVLILDEVHALHTPLPELFALLDTRARLELPTVIASGMTLSEFGAWVGAAALSRALRGKVVDGFAKSESRK